MPSLNDLAINGLRSATPDPADPQIEGTYRRGFHQAVAAIAFAMQHKEFNAEDLVNWVEGDGMEWRHDKTLELKIPPPPLCGIEL